MVSGLDSAKTEIRSHDRARLTLPQLLGLVGIIVAGGLLFCGSSAHFAGHSIFSIFLFAAAMAGLGISALHLRQIYSDHLAETRARNGSSTWHERLADAVLTAVITLFAMKACSYGFDHTHDPLEWPASILFFGLVVMCFQLLRERNAARALAAEPVPAAAVAVTSLSSSELHYVEAEDHYVKLVFSDRVEHKRARFSDVIEDLGETGMRVHKSFWVNRAQVTGTRRAGRRLVLVLRDGVEIPVGRSIERKVVDALSPSSEMASAPFPPPAQGRIRPGAAPPGP